MFPGKESLIELEELARQQIRIYPDACDIGIQVVDDQLRTRIHRLCQNLAKIYKNKAKRWNGGSEWSCFIPFEQEGRNYIGVNLSVSYNTDRIRKANFFHIEICRGMQEETPFKG